MLKTSLHENTTHLFTGHSGWDRMELTSNDEKELNQFADNAARQFWHIWYQGSRDIEPTNYLVLYKPHGITSQWEDNYEGGYELINENSNS
jgi:hypothetical protein